MVSVEEGVRGGEELSGREQEGNFQGLGNVLYLVLLVLTWVDK